MSENSKILIEELENYAQSDMYPFHMPGHKRNMQFLPYKLPFNIDITEIYGFDDLHDAHGILKNSHEKAKKVFRSQYSYMLVGGSTCGILAAVSCVANWGDEIIIARNCHKSVYNACMLNNLHIHFVYPKQDNDSGVCMSVDTERVESMIEKYPLSKAVVITSPTYEGVISDIKNISEIVHRYNIPLIVDNAHGAHQRFCRLSRKGEPIENGADVVISSLHKTLPALTQTAVANLQGDFVKQEVFEQKLSIFETSSPSYVLMSSMDVCFDFLTHSEKAFDEYSLRLESFSQKMKSLEKLKVLCHGEDSIENHGFFGFDIGKIVIVTTHTNISGIKLTEILRERYHIELEMAYPTYAVAMTSVCDSDEGFDRLAYALTEIDKKLEYKNAPLYFPDIPKPEKADINTDKDTVSDRYIYAYPPGVPIVIPGEVMDKETKNYIEKLKKAGVKVLQ